MVALFIALCPHNPENYSIVINTDNIASQLVLSTGAGKDYVLCACARNIWKFAAIHSCTVSVVHKPGQFLMLADAFSRQFKDSATYDISSKMCKDLQLARVRVMFDDKLLDSNL